jgi:hypothetical protein
MPTILLKKSDTASAVPTTANLTNLAGGVEVAVNTADRRMFTMTSASAVVELGTNPSSLTLTGGTANGVLYLNGSKVATSGSALTFDGTNLLTLAASTPKIRVSDSGLANDFGLDFYFPSIASSYGQVTLNASTGGMRFVAGKSGSSGYYQAFELNGSEQARLTSTGLGIGTSSPAYKLDVAESGAPTSTNTFSVARISGSDSVANDLTLLGPNTSQVRIKFGDPESATIGEVGYNHSTNSLRFVTNGAEAGVFDSSGSLGLGVTPSAWNSAHKVIDIGTYGSVDNEPAVNGFNLVSNGYYNASNQWIYKNTAAASLLRLNEGGFKFFTAASGTAGNQIALTQAMTLDASGNLGVGITSPNSRLDVVGGTGIRVNEDGAGTKVIQIRSNFAGVAPAINVSTNDPLLFQTNNTERARITAGGQFIIGASTGNGRLTVYGTGTSGSTYSFETANSNGNTTFLVANDGTARFYKSDLAESARFTATGNLLVGTTTDVSGRSGVISDVSGNVRAIPRTGSEKTSAYTLAITDVGQFVQVGTSGSVTVPNDTFATGDVVSVFNNTTGNISLNCPITTAYVGGTNTDRASVTLSTRGVATVLFINPSLCVINGNVS